LIRLNTYELFVSNIYIYLLFALILNYDEFEAFHPKALIQ